MTRPQLESAIKPNLARHGFKARELDRSASRPRERRVIGLYRRSKLAASHLLKTWRQMPRLRKLVQTWAKRSGRPGEGAVGHAIA